MTDFAQPFGFPFHHFAADARFCAKKEITIDGRKYRLVEEEPKLKHGNFNLERNPAGETLLKYGRWNILAITKNGRFRLIAHIPSDIGFDVCEHGEIFEEGQ